MLIFKRKRERKTKIRILILTKNKSNNNTTTIKNEPNIKVDIAAAVENSIFWLGLLVSLSHISFDRLLNIQIFYN